MFAVFQNVGERSRAKNYCPVSLFSALSKVFEKFVNNRVIWRNATFFLIYSLVVDLLNQLQIFWQLDLIEVLGLLTGLELLAL